MTTVAARRRLKPLPPPPRKRARYFERQEVIERLQIVYRTVTGREKLDKRVQLRTPEVYEAYRKMAAASGNGCGYATREDVIRLCWPLEPGEDWRKHGPQLLRIEQRLHAAGVLCVRPQAGPSAGEQTRCVFWELLDADPDPDLYPVGCEVRPAGVAQSVGAAEQQIVRRRSWTCTVEPDESIPVDAQRVGGRLWTRRCDRRAPERFLVTWCRASPGPSRAKCPAAVPGKRAGQPRPPRGVFHAQSCGGGPPTGSPPTAERDLDARARGPAPPGIEVDAITRCCPPEARAALAELRSTAAGEEGAAALAALRAGADGVPIVVVALAGWEAARRDGLPPALSRRWATRLDRAAGQLDRCHGAGAAATLLLDRLADLSPTGFDLAARPLAEVHTLTYYVAELRSQARAAVRHDRWARGRRESPHPRPWIPRGRA